MSDVGKAVFLSYASQDAEAARKICESLRQGGAEVWFDADGGLEHGDEWDAKIRRQIKECVLFIPVISANTQAREEGYFRLEWDLAAERARTIASGVPFILPVVIDDTREPDALVPDRFRAVQWTRLRGGEVPPEVQQRFLKLWSHRTGVLKNEAARSGNISPGFASRPGFHAGRGLAAVVFTDVVGYSSRMQRDETGTMALVAADFELMRERCAEHEGEVLNSMGDGLLMCFTSAVQAVACALQIQADFGRRRSTLPPERSLEHRMGVHIGDVFRQETGGVAGDGVNIAARLEGKAPPGGVCISQMVHDTVKGKVPMQAVFIGPESFKNITEPIPIWHVAAEGGPTLSRPPMPVKAKPAADRKRRRWKIAGVVAAAIAGLSVAGYSGYRWYYKLQEAAVLEALNMTPPEPVRKDGRVLVARFENRTGDAGLEMSGQLVADHVRRRLPELEWVNEAVALRDSDRLAPEATAEEMRSLAKKTGGDALVTGYYFKEGGRVMFSGRVFDLKRERIFAELAPIAGEATALAAAIEETAERLVGVTVSMPRVRRGKEDVGKFVNFSVPRRFDAAQILDRGPLEDLTHYRRSYERDPQGALSSLVLLAYRHATEQHYADVDKVLAEVDTAPGVAQLTPYSVEVAHWARATAGGDGEGVEQAVEAICRWQPSNRYWRTQRVLVMFRANKPRAILKEFAGVTPGSPGEKVWAVWSSRALAYFLLQDWPNMETAAKRLRAVDPQNDAGLEAVAYVAIRRGDIAEAMRMLDAYDSVKDKGNSTFNLYISVLAAMRQAGQAEKPEFAALVRRAEAWFASRPKKESESKETRTAHCEMLYLAGRYAEARQRAEKLAAEFPDDVRIRSYVATAAIRLGDTTTANATWEWLRALDPKYRFGYPLFAQAKIATLLGQPDDALRLLREAFGQYTVEMKDFSWQGLLVSPDFDPLRSDPRFKEFIAPKG